MQSQRRLTTTGGAQSLAFSFEALALLLGRVPSSASEVSSVSWTSIMSLRPAIWDVRASI